jgi:hypothetical protein
MPLIPILALTLMGSAHASEAAQAADTRLPAVISVGGAVAGGCFGGCLALVFGRNQAACAVEVDRKSLFSRCDGLQAGSVLDECFHFFQALFLDGGHARVSGLFQPQAKVLGVAADWGTAWAWPGCNSREP